MSSTGKTLIRWLLFPEKCALQSLGEGQELTKEKEVGEIGEKYGEDGDPTAPF